MEADNRLPDGSTMSGIVSPNGFVFGVQGWNWPEARLRSITFYLDGTATVRDQFGRPVKGTNTEGKEVWFAIRPPQSEDKNPGYIMSQDGPKPKLVKLSTHAEVIEALTLERVDWTKLDHAGWPQLEYEELKKLPDAALPPLPNTQDEQDSYLAELRKIKDGDLRRAALRMQRERWDARAKELASIMDE